MMDAFLWIFDQMTWWWINSYYHPSDLTRDLKQIRLDMSAARQSVSALAQQLGGATARAPTLKVGGIIQHVIRSNIQIFTTPNFIMVITTPK